ncbi:MAG: DNA polymerase III subunit delta [Lachnospiraceae bacterium]|nr:DNA polymerase III subunit delta [Lachnospiraceae bacterium]
MASQLDDDIKNKSIKSVYLLYGTEQYLKKNYRDLILKVLFPEGTEGSMNYTLFSGTFDMKELIGTARTMPFFADNRAICVQESGLFSGKGRKDDLEMLSDYLEKPEETTKLIFLESSVKKTLKAVKQIEKTGNLTELLAWKWEKLKKWVLSRMKRNSLEITREAYDAFIEMTSVNSENTDTMLFMDNELEKLVSYCAGAGRIEYEDVRTIVVDCASSKVFSLVDAIVEKDEKALIKIYSDMLMTKEDPARIISLLEQQFLKLLETDSLVSGTASLQRMEEVIGPEWMVRKQRRLLSRIKKEDINNVLRQANRYDLLIKSGKMKADDALVALLLSAVRRK